MEISFEEGDKREIIVGPLVRVVDRDGRVNLGRDIAARVRDHPKEFPGGKVVVIAVKLRDLSDLEKYG